MAIKNVVWASQAKAGEVIMPPVEKMLHGYSKEIPAAEHFNWIFQNLTGRLKTLEETWRDASLISRANTRPTIIKAGELFKVPEYTVGEGALHIYIDGLHCICGEDDQYQEVGEVGETSTNIVFNDPIPIDFEIIVQTKANNVTMDYEQWVRVKVDQVDFSADDWVDGELELNIDPTRTVVTIYRGTRYGSATIDSTTTLTRQNGKQILKTRDKTGFDGYVLVFTAN